MQNNQTMGSQLQQLLTAISKHGNQHVLEIQRDLVQTNNLLEEAIRKLGNSFLAIHQGLSSYQQLSNLPDLKSSGEQLAALQTEINQHINAAITGLQFQDMTSQLITKMSKHIAELHDVFAVMDRSDRQIPATADDAAILAILHVMNTELQHQRLVFDDVSRKIVTQQHLESGDIELF
ncbi:MAG: chemotaxis protein [Sulfuriferula sp.]|jgi:hypothetical protein|nr:chemotaxis protein [Sulfuriferula sp.]